ncbi:MAG: YdiU family protein [Paracoccaceae bacterium]
MSLQIPFDNTYAALPQGFYTYQDAAPVSDPKLVAFNEDLALQLGLTHTEANDLAQVFSGNKTPEGAAPLAQLYAGHQFGTYNPQLGDGRALLLGEVINSNGLRVDIQLKGSGPTPYSRMGDGRAWLGPVLREYVVSEAMHALGVPTTRALCAVTTGDMVYREAALPGAVLTRVATSHIRVGTFQVFAHRGDIQALKTLTEYTIQRHCPDADGPLGLLRHVVALQAKLIPAWMSFGFIHGVMNTDNCTISGETIDYGPCAFMDSYAVGKVFSSIDRTGRYAFGQQPNIIVWNMAQFATALIQQMDDKEAAIEAATAIIHEMPVLLEQEWLRRFAAKIGIAAPTQQDASLIQELLTLMETQGADFTNTFHALVGGTARDQFADPTAYNSWESTWRARLAHETNPTDVMRHANPYLIPRNHQVEAMIAAAVAGDYALFDKMLRATAYPFEPNESFLELTRAPHLSEHVTATFCGT